MNIEKRIIVQAVKTDNNELIPIWDDRLSFEKTEMYGNEITLDNDIRKQYHDVVECIFNLKTKKLELGIELNYFPTEDDLEFKKGSTVLYEVGGRKLKQCVIKDIVFEEFDLEILKGKKVVEYYQKRFPEIIFEDNSFYTIKSWTPVYVLDDNTKVYWNYKLYNLVK